MNNYYIMISSIRRLSAFLLLPLLMHASAQAQDGSSTAAPGQWITLPESNQPLKRHENAYTKAGDTFYLIGGRGERPVEIYDPAANTWTTGATPPLSMHHFQAVSHEGKIYVLGAFTDGFPDETPVPHVYIYDPESDSWEKGPEIPEGRRRGAAGAVSYNGKIYLVGGIQNGHIDGHVRWLDVFDPDTGEWEQLANAPRFRDHFQAAVVGDKLYAAGGRRTSHATGRTLELTIPEVDVYDFSTGTWTPLPPSGDLPAERAGTTAITVGNRLVILGGESGSQVEAHSEVEVYNPETGEWYALAPMNTGRHGTQAIVHDGKIYIAAGSETRGATEINSQEVFILPDSLYKK